MEFLFETPATSSPGEQLRPAAIQAPVLLRASRFGPRLPFKGALHSETLVRFALPKRNATLRAGFFASHAFAWMDSTYIKGEYEEPLGALTDSSLTGRYDFNTSFCSHVESV